MDEKELKNRRSVNNNRLIKLFGVAVALGFWANTDWDGAMGVYAGLLAVGWIVLIDFDAEPRL